MTIKITRYVPLNVLDDPKNLAPDGKYPFIKNNSNLTH